MAKPGTKTAAEHVTIAGSPEKAAGMNVTEPENHQEIAVLAH